MELYIDTADIKQVKEFKPYFPLDGVTINPTLVASNGRQLEELLEDLLPLTENYLHVQVVTNQKSKIIQQAKKLSSLSKKIVVKIPVSKEGIAAMQTLNSSQIQITATAVFGVAQAVIAAKTGVKYIAPYVSRIDRIEQSGVDTVKNMKKVLSSHGYESKIIAASIKNANQAKQLMKVGVRAMTLSPDVLIQSQKHYLTDRAIEMFQEDWCKEFDNQTLDIHSSKNT